MFAGKRPVEIAKLAPGTRFILHGVGKTGTLNRLGVGSATVTIDRQVSKSFTPKTGRRAGETVTITQERETTQWSLGTLVIPLKEGESA